MKHYNTVTQTSTQPIGKYADSEGKEIAANKVTAQTKKDATVGKYVGSDGKEIAPAASAKQNNDTLKGPGAFVMDNNEDAKPAAITSHVQASNNQPGSHVQYFRDALNAGKLKATNTPAAKNKGYYISLRTGAITEAAASAK